MKVIAVDNIYTFPCIEGFVGLCRAFDRNGRGSASVEFSIAEGTEAWLEQCTAHQTKMLADGEPYMQYRILRQ